MMSEMSARVRERDYMGRLNGGNEKIVEKKTRGGERRVAIFITAC